MSHAARDPRPRDGGPAQATREQAISQGPSFEEPEIGLLIVHRWDPREKPLRWVKQFGGDSWRLSVSSDGEPP